MTTPPGRTKRARANPINPVKCETQGKRCPTQSTARGPQPTPGLPPPGPAEHALHGTSRGPAPRTRPGAGDAAPKLYAPRPARVATPPSTRTSPLGLHRSHCRVRRLGHATLGPHPWGKVQPASHQTQGRGPKSTYHEPRIRNPRPTQREPPASSRPSSLPNMGRHPGTQVKPKFTQLGPRRESLHEPQIEHSTILQNRWVTTTSSRSPLQRFHPRGQSQAQTELLRPSSTSFFFRNFTWCISHSITPHCSHHGSQSRTAIFQGSQICYVGSHSWSQRRTSSPVPTQCGEDNRTG